ncbi:DUF6602 domain-containing protein [Winogradskya consettensis]|uniref:DUF6602 domain-containing protein n=1 Tax=Winogradskya consettensis TaxID=113560 RepID=A0A919T2E9_9ACTN|nr:DUF6602 domain-containing protein [Actinoplanes consettensis]GIM83860.1 hypothetical protein Aco04nite_88600 [Actinoplanes consettensis]
MPDESEIGMQALTDSWRPKRSPENLHRALGGRYKYVEKLLLLRSAAEVDFRDSNFGSGLPIEAIFRDELSRLLPTRYTVTCGTVSDRNGLTAGDCDVVLTNQEWFPAVKARATPDARYQVAPIEAVYGVLEVKQTLDTDSLDSAMAKLVRCHRLFRPLTAYSRFTENRGLFEPTDWLGNPLFSAIVAVRKHHDATVEDLLDRFVRLNRTLQRLEMVQCLCILGEGCFFWGWNPPGAENPSVATFRQEDLTADLHVVQATEQHGESALGGLMSRMLGHINQVVLSPADIAVHYGAGDSLKSRIPDLIPIHAQKEWSPRANGNWEGGAS